MKKWLYTLLIFALFASCSEKETQIVIPENILSKQKMIEVITEIHLQEARNNQLTLPDSSSSKDLHLQDILENASISKEEYDNSFAFYVAHPYLLNEVYKDVLDELSSRQGKATKQ